MEELDLWLSIASSIMTICRALWACPKWLNRRRRRVQVRRELLRTITQARKENLQRDFGQVKHGREELPWFFDDDSTRTMVDRVSAYVDGEVKEAAADRRGQVSWAEFVLTDIDGEMKEAEGKAFVTFFERLGIGRRPESEQPNNSGQEPAEPPRSYSRLLAYLPRRFREEFGQEFIDFLKEGLKDLKGSNTSWKKFAIRETLSLALLIGKKRLFGFRQRKRRTL